ncbi:GtrA family protein [uncultured Clostridium sp.]|uniref:GtrA family protein n=1 Tax=uncultured Clostridium sp. TaxID=59620 RepID=UPI003216B7F2
MSEDNGNRFKLLMRNIRDGESKKFMFLRFAFVGGINTIHNYIWYALFLLISMPYMISFTLAFIISMIGSFFLNCYFTFKTKPTLSKFIKFPLTTLANYCISTVTLYILVKILDIQPFIAGPLASILPIPITFLMTKLLLKEEGIKLKKITGKRIAYGIFIAIVFLGIAILSHRSYIFDQMVFVNNGTDSMDQFMYFIPFIENVISRGDIMWSWTYGLGGDVLSEFSYYYTTSPFFYILYFIRNIFNIDLSYSRTIDLKLCLSIFKQVSIMTFMYGLLRYEGRKWYTSLIGAITYGVSIIFIRNGISFDYMTDAMVWLPLTILGYKIWQRTRKNFVLILGITLTVLNNFYFAYMSLIFYCIYAIVFTCGEGNSTKEKVLSYFKKGLQYGMKIILSIGIATVLFMPAIIAFMGADRFQATYNVPQLFSRVFYKCIFDNIFLYNNIVGIPLIGLLLFTLSIKGASLETKKKTILTLIFLLLFMIPMAYSMFNGFSYISDRWIYIFIFVLSYSIPNWMEEINTDKKREFVIILSLIFLILIMMYTKKSRVGSKLQVMELRILLTGMVSIVLIYIKDLFKSKYVHRFIEVLIIVCVLIGSLGNAMGYMDKTYTKDYDVMPEKLYNRGMDNNLERKILDQTIPKTNEFYRTIYEISNKENSPMNYMNYGASAYNSLINKNVHKWMKVDYNVVQEHVSPSRFANFNNRLFLESAFGVRYKLEYDNKQIPYGYKMKSVNDKYILCENNNTVGFDLWYDSYENIDKLEYLNYAQRDAVLLNTALVDKEIQGVKKSELQFDTINKLEVNFNNAKLSNVKYEDGKLYVKESGEIILPIDNKYNNVDGEILFTINIRPENGERFDITVNDRISKKEPESGQWTYPLNEFTFKLNGNAESITMELTPGTYTIDKMELWHSSYEKYNQWVDARNKYNIESLVVDGPHVSGNISNNEKGILALSIPYKNGWTAKVDGKKVNLLKVNGIFTGIELDEGYHSLELRYITPGLILGGLISICSLIVCLVWYIIGKRNLKNEFKSRI